MAFLRNLAFLCSIFLCISLSHAQSRPRSLNLTFTTIDVPGSMATDVLGINNTGQMIGYYYDSGNGATSTGFLLSGGNFTYFNYPGADATEGTGINDSGLISGTAYFAQNTVSIGFTYNSGAFARISVPNQEFTVLRGINNAGNIGGSFGSGVLNNAFVLIGTKFQDVTPPPGGWITAVANGVNNLGEAVGNVVGGLTQDNGFSYVHGTFHTITVPGLVDGTTVAWGVNDNGIVVGSYCCSGSSLERGFVMFQGKYLTFDYPGATDTFASGINNAGQIVGSYTFSDQEIFYGFVTSPVTPADFEEPGCCLVDPNWREP
jgi:hypothetical protein